jgi:hypothetical protein
MGREIGIDYILQLRLPARFLLLPRLLEEKFIVENADFLLDGLVLCTRMHLLNPFRPILVSHVN